MFNPKKRRRVWSLMSVIGLVIVGGGILLSRDFAAGFWLYGSYLLAMP